jgi:hypothetical protein
MSKLTCAKAVAVTALHTALIMAYAGNSHLIKTVVQPLKKKS